MDNNKTGSYQLDSLSNPDAELARLKKQGELFRDLEVATLKKCGLKQDHKVLELGCGPGFITKILADMVKNGELISVDNDPGFIDTLQKTNIPPPKSGFKAVHASADDLPIESNWADFSYARFLFQHVPAPQAIVAEAFRCTKPGGLFCGVDSDDGLITHYPDNPAISTFLKNAKDKQTAYGGDRLVGRKLYNLFHESGFKNIKAHILSLTTAEIPPQALFGILFGYKSSLIGNKEEIAKLIQALTKKAAREEFLLSAGVFIVVGQKPSD